MRKINIDREAVIAQIAGIIYEFDAVPPDADDRAAWEHWQDINSRGWTIEVRLPGETYLDNRSYTRIEGAVLGDNELRRALQLATDFAAGGGWMWRYHDLVMAGYTLRRIATALGVRESVVGDHWHCRSTPSAAHRSALLLLHRHALPGPPADQTDLEALGREVKDKLSKHDY